MQLRNTTLMLFLLLAVLLLNVSARSSLESLARKNKPIDFSLADFEKTCEMCGQFFGYETTYNCMMDPSNKIFHLCLKAVGKK